MPASIYDVDGARFRTAIQALHLALPPFTVLYYLSSFAAACFGNTHVGQRPELKFLTVKLLSMSFIVISYVSLPDP